MNTNSQTTTDQPCLCEARKESKKYMINKIPCPIPSTYTNSRLIILNETDSMRRKDNPSTKLAILKKFNINHQLKFHA